MNISSSTQEGSIIIDFRGYVRALACTQPPKTILLFGGAKPSPRSFAPPMSKCLLPSCHPRMDFSTLLTAALLTFTTPLHKLMNPHHSSSFSWPPTPAAAPSTHRKFSPTSTFVRLHCFFETQTN